MTRLPRGDDGEPSSWPLRPGYLADEALDADSRFSTYPVLPMDQTALSLAHGVAHPLQAAAVVVTCRTVFGNGTTIRAHGPLSL